MPEFVLDTSGTVFMPLNYPHDPYEGVAWDDLTPFARGHIEAMFADLDKATCFPGFDDGWRRARFADLAPETLARIIDDCRWHPNAQPHKHPGDPQMQWRSGRNAWEDRNPKGADYGRGLSFPPLAPYLGDDGKVYLS